MRTPFDLSQITEFNPAIIYGFEPESQQSVEPNPNTVEYVIHAAGQYQDMFQAYLYAQNTILPHLRTHGLAQLSPVQIIQWLDHIHLLIANTLAKDVQTSAGQVVKTQVVRWHHGFDVGLVIKNYLSDTICENVMYNWANNSGLDIKLFKKFILLFKKIQKMSVEIPDYEKPYLQANLPLNKGSIIFTKLFTLYHNNKLSDSERNIVEHFLKICSPPPLMPVVQEKFANDILIAWRQCNSQDIDSISKLVTKAFYGITEGHWYFNGNGRAATCFVNIILRSMNKPSILMRKPDERYNPESTYSKAILHINSKLEMLEAHIKQRIIEAENNQVYRNDKSREIIELRVQFSNLVSAIKINFPSFKINDFYAKNTDEFCCAKKGENLDDAVISIFKLQIQVFREKFKELLQGKANRSIVIPAPIQKQYSQEENAIILSALEKLTGYTVWVMHKSTAILELDDHQTAENLMHAFNKTGAMQAELKSIGNKWVLRLVYIKPELLSSIKLLDGITRLDESFKSLALNNL